MLDVTADSVAGLVSDTLRRSALSPGKVAHKIKADPRAFKNYWDGEAAPPAARLIQLMAECRDLEIEILNLIGKIRGNVSD